MHDAAILIAAIAGKNPLGTYLVIYLVTVLLGNISAFASFWVVFEANFGILGFLVLIFVIFLADMTEDLIWYSLGRSLRGTRFGLWIEKHIPGHAQAETMVKERGLQWLFLSKFIIGGAPVVTFSIGWTGMNFKRFYKNSLLSILLWLPVLTLLAYGIVSGLAPLAAAKLGRIEWVALGGFVLFIILDYAIANGVKFLAKHFLKMADVDNKGEYLTNPGDENYHGG